MLCCQFAYSQTFYEFKYHYGSAEDGDLQNFKSLVLRNEDGTGIMRVEFYDQEKERLIVEMNIEEHFLDNDDGSVDSNSLILVGKDVKFIVGESTFTADHFIFIKKDGVFEPAKVFTIEDTTTVEGDFDNVRLLNEADLTEEFVLQFFTKDEDFYKGLFETEVRSLSPQQQKTRLFLLVVANTNDKKIGKTCIVDRKNVFDTYKEVAEFLEIPFVSKVIEGDQFSKVNVDKAINTWLRPTAKDIVIFYYSGHGFAQKDNYKFPYLDLRDKSFQDYGGIYTMNMEAIYQKIKMKGARLNLVISDCCNNDPSQPPFMTSEDPDTRVSSIGWDKNKCISLFMETKLSLLMTAAQKGEYSAGNVAEGGFFTSNFLQTLEKHIGKVRTTATPLETSWKSIYEMTVNETTIRANRKPCRLPDGTAPRCVQHPVVRSN